MKTKLQLITVALFAAFTANAQTYGFQKTTGFYSNLLGTTSLNNNTTWDDPTYEVPLGFSFDVYGNSYDTLYFEVGLGAEYTFKKSFLANPLAFLGAYSADLIDRGEYSGVSQSPIDYKVEGSTGNRIFKLEYTNAGFYDDLDDDSVSTDFVNFQLWLYESNNNIEIHFGPSNITQPNLCFYTGVGSAHFVSANLDLNNGSISTNTISLSGNPSNPTAAVDSALGFVNGTPADGTIYRFINGGTVSIDELVKENIRLNMFPNPAIDFINLEINKSELISPFVNIYDMNGKLVASPSFSQQIMISELNKGAYFIEAFTKDGKAVGKFIKQ